MDRDADPSAHVRYWDWTVYRDISTRLLPHFDLFLRLTEGRRSKILYLVVWCLQYWVI